MAELENWEVEASARARARARARAELELEAERRKTPAAPARPGLGQLTYEALSEVPGALVEGIKAPFSAASKILEGEKGFAPPVSLMAERARRMVTDNPAQSIRTAATLGAIPVGLATGPLGAAASAPLLNRLGGEISERLGYEAPSTPEQEYKELITGGVSALAPLGAAKGVGRAVKSLPTMTERSALYRSVDQEGVIAGLHDAPKGTTATERAFASRAVEYEPEFIGRDPLAGIDPKDPLALKKYQASLGDLLEKGKKTKSDVLSQVALKEKAQREALARSGEAIDENTPLAFRETDIDFGRLDRLKQGATEAQIAGVEATKRELLNEFYEPKMVLGKDSRYQVSGEPDLARPKVRSIAEYDELLKTIDSRIKELGGYDDKYLASIGQNPSTIDSQVRALRAARGALSEGIRNYIRSNLGDEAASAFARANDDIAVAVRYGDLVERFNQQTPEALTPGSGRSLQPSDRSLPVSLAGLVSRAGRSRTTMSYLAGAERAERMIRNTQQIIRWRTGVETPPLLSRNWDLVKTNPRAMAMVSSLAAAGGLDPQQMLSASESEQKKLLPKLAQDFPDAFEPAEGGYRSLFDGKLNSPVDRDAHMGEALSAKLPPGKEAEILGPLLERGEYVPVNRQESTPVQLMQKIEPRLDLRDFIDAFEPANTPIGISAGGSSSSETEQMLAQMRRSNSMINIERSGL